VQKILNREKNLIAKKYFSSICIFRG